MYENCVITWNTRTQDLVATSSPEAEYMALYEGVKEVIWIKSLLQSINYEINDAVSSYEDNQSCIRIASDLTNYKRMKHIDIKYHFTREQVEKHIIKLKYVPTDEQLADMFTKHLPCVKFHLARSRLQMNQ